MKTHCLFKKECFAYAVFRYEDRPAPAHRSAVCDADGRVFIRRVVPRSRRPRPVFAHKYAHRRRIFEYGRSRGGHGILSHLSEGRVKVRVCVGRA